MGASVTDRVSILPPTATPMELAIERLVRVLGDTPVPIDTILNPSTCPASLLPWLAWAFGVYVWRSDWPEAVQRNIVRDAISIKRRQGTTTSVRDVVAPFGTLAIREWWQQDPPGDPYTFDLVMTATGAVSEALSAEAFEEVMAHVERTKPVRSWFTATQGLLASGGVALAAVTRPIVMLRLMFDSVLADLPPTGPNEGKLDFSNAANSSLLGVI